jgi:hypothetical protein
MGLMELLHLEIVTLDTHIMEIDNLFFTFPSVMLQDPRIVLDDLPWMILCYLQPIMYLMMS